MIAVRDGLTSDNSTGSKGSETCTEVVVAIVVSVLALV